MSDYGALAGAQMIANTLRIQEFGRILRESDDLHQLAADNALLRQQGAEIVERYNRLAAEFNELMRRAVDVAEDSDLKTATIARLQKANADMQAECERLRFRLTDVSTELAVLRQLDRERNPDAYPSG